MVVTPRCVPKGCSIVVLPLSVAQSDVAFFLPLGAAVVTWPFCFTPMCDPKCCVNFFIPGCGLKVCGLFFDPYEWPEGARQFFVRSAFFYPYVRPEGEGNFFYPLVQPEWPWQFYLHLGAARRAA